MSPQAYSLMPSIVMSIQDVLKPELTDKFVSFEGWIISRTLVKPGFGPNSFSKDIGSSCMYTRLHLQDSSRSEDIWVYLNDSNILSEKGLIPGNRVRFYGLERKLSQLNNIYCRLVPLSSIQILCTEAERAVGRQILNQNQADRSKQIPLLSLVDLWVPSNTGHVFQAICDIEKILKVSLKCLCETCGSVVINTACLNTACNGGGAYKFLARASAIIDDSTSVAMVTLTGSSVQSLLQLSHDQWKCLEEKIGQTGEVFIQQFSPTLSTSVERFVYMLCDNHAVKQTWLMSLKTRSSLDINKIGHDEFCMKTFDTGSSRISTQCLPFLQLECVAMNIFEPSVWAIHHLSVR
ncbi:CST complex subunit CTC1-like [Mercenaria mercenaria]|uniref:CST complex subunit CTC1-like n=1 Tax=Mercenaria mercenaria TaxID=6596 RepID=UPI00234EECD4|nr:CST complex subunit CTC1-like [Mercenaria mercenaria]